MLTGKHILLLQAAYGGVLDWLDATGKNRLIVLDLQHWGLVDASLQITASGIAALEQANKLIALTF